MGKMFLFHVDATTKWVEVEMVEKATSEKTIEILRKIFATHGLPRRIVTDNTTVFTSCEMKEFFKRNAIGSVTSAPYHPSTNGLAERYVQTFKRNLKKMSTGSLQTKLSRFLFTYRNTPQNTTGQTPAKLLMNRRPHTHLQCLLPNTAETVASKQEKERQDTKAQERYFSENDDVYVENY